MHLPDEFFAQTEDVTREGLLGTYVHGNEPSHHIPYLYSWTTEPWKTQYWIREIMNRMYRNNIEVYAATTTAARCPPGTSSQPWAFIRYAQEPISM